MIGCNDTTRRDRRHAVCHSLVNRSIHKTRSLSHTHTPMYSAPNIMMYTYYHWWTAATCLHQRSISWVRACVRANHSTHHVSIALDYRPQTARHCLLYIIHTHDSRVEWSRNAAFILYETSHKLKFHRFRVLWNCCTTNQRRVIRSRQTDRHTHHNTSHPSRGRGKVTHKPIIQSTYALISGSVCGLQGMLFLETRNTGI